MSDETYDQLHARAEQLSSAAGERVPVALVIRQAIRDYLSPATESDTETNV